MQKEKNVNPLLKSYKKSLRITLLFLLLNIIYATSAFAVTYYVATTGSDNTGTGGSSNPWETVNYALTQISEGDVIKIKKGTYNIGTNYININNPVNHANITITADDKQNRPKLIGDRAAERVILIEKGVKGVTISYLELIHSNQGRIETWKQGVIEIKDNPTIIDNNLIYNGYNGIHLNTNKNVTISNNIIHTMGKIETNPDDASASGVCIGIYNFQNLGPANGWNEKIYIYNNEAYGGEDGLINVNTHYRYIEIAYNDFHDNYEDGIDNKDGEYFKIHHNSLHNNWSNGIGALDTYPNHNFEIYANKIYNNGWWGIMVQGTNQTNWKIYNNLIYGNCNNPAYYGANAVNLWGSGHEFYNNTVCNNTVPGSQSNTGYTGNAIVRNNIFYNNASQNGGNIRSDSGGIIESNYVYPTTAGITGNNTITDPDPKFVDELNGDFTLQSDSPLINMGIDIGITDDHFGNPRPIYGGYDIGAYEYTVIAPKNLRKK
ncbi:MAG: right-handed parallel beta-helix repeat-containing protein [Thermodesulfobacteriota bacterium]|nr:right-handed parallel beta-helix repeat-containing protein [Thermodesulfobacteriota bacterium]